MFQDLKLDVFYPHSPQKVWQAITNRKALATWFMDNDFEPRIGHFFRFHSPGSRNESLAPTIYCQIIELEEPKSLAFTWRGSFTATPTVVSWKLEPVEGGTRLKLEHSGRVTKASAMSKTASTIETTMIVSSFPASPLPHLPTSPSTQNIDIATLDFHLNGGWHTALQERLKHLLETSS